MHHGAANRGKQSPLCRVGGFCLGDEEFAFISQLVRERFGINLTEAKRALVASRLQSLLREKGMKDFTAYCHYLRADRSGAAIDELVNRITTNYTFFGREKDHFDFFANTALPEAIRRQQKASRRDLRIWSAACSTGEEAYTLAMLAMETLGHSYRQWDAGVLATDISARALATAKAGIYANESVQGLPAAFRERYFRRLDDGRWQVRDILRREVVFRRFNLMNEVFPFKRPFDIIFCRNVMIYFDQTAKEKLIQRLWQFLEPGGYLFIGHAESLISDNRFAYIKPAIYRRLA